MQTRAAARGEGVQAIAKLIECFLDLLAASRQSLPSVRCLYHSTLIGILDAARELVDSPTIRAYSGTGLVQLLEDSKVIQEIPVERGVSPRNPRLYSVGFGPSATAIPAAELLQAYVPDGVLCYFTAIELHGLSTQPAPHYHVATFRSTASGRADSGWQAAASSNRQPPLGTLEFTAEGIGYYRTSRDRSNLVGIQRRQLNPYCVVRVTNLEQTLLDCLHRPRSAGGPPIVFEAWERGLERATPGKVLALAMKIGDETQIRRVGYMIERFAPLSPAIQDVRRLIDGFRQQDSYPTLLPGIAYSHESGEWGLRTP